MSPVFEGMGETMLADSEMDGIEEVTFVLVYVTKDGVEIINTEITVAE